MELKNTLIRTAMMLIWFVAQHATAQIKNLKGKELSGRAIDSFILSQMDSLKIPALSIAIIQNGRIMYYKATGIKNDRQEAIDTNTLFEAASITKPVFAYAVHKLVQDGRMNLDSPLYRYYPYDDMDHDNRYKLITARMVLSHTTGFPNWRGGGGGELSINFEPGTKYGYSGEGFDYLGLVVKHLLGKNMQDIVEEHVFHPLSIHNSFLIKNKYVLDHLANGLKDNKEWGWNNLWLRPNIALTLCTEAKEYAKFVIRLMKESNAPNSVFRQMSVPQMQVEPNKWVCLGLFMEQTPYGPKYSHSGNNNNRFNSNFEFYKDHDLGYVFFMNCHQEPELTKRLNRFLKKNK
jgi:CubicO group peptidase (beta-lactamase class C family)